MEEKELQEKVETEAEVNEVKEVKVPKGFYLAEVPTGFAKVIAKGEEQISAEDLIVKMANALEEAGLMK